MDRLEYYGEYRMTCLNLPDRIYAQYRTKPKALAWYQITRSIGDPLCQSFDDIRKTYQIDWAFGESLDVIGRIVGIDRNVLGQVVFEVYECNTDGEFECNTDGDYQLGIALLTDDIDLSDEYFRILIRAKITKNNSDATIEGILASISFILGGVPSLSLEDNEDMSFSFNFYDEITALQRTILNTENLIPKPQGVRINGYYEFFAYSQCNADGEFECNTDGDNECVGFTEF